MHQYKLISKKGEGTFSEVLKAQSLKTGNYVAIKCMKNHFTSIDQVNHLREIQALRKLSPHDNIIQLLEILYDEPTGRLALVFELMDMNLYEYIKDKKSYLNPQKVKYYMYQLLKAIEHMHKNGIFHRDIKPENILLLGDHVKLADFGSCKGMFSDHPYTEYISTRWYRAPECLLTDGFYDYKMDIWGVGCVFFEIVCLFPLFPGNNELDQIHRIHNILGTPNPRVLDRFKKHATHMDVNFPPKNGTGFDKSVPPSHNTKECLDLIKMLLTYDPEERITATQALRHEYFRDLWELDQIKDFQGSLTSIRLSPNAKKNSDLMEKTNNGPSKNDSYIDQSDKDKSYVPSNTMKKLANKTQKKSGLPSVQLNLKVEGVFKPAHGEYSSAEEENEKLEKAGVFLPPIKNSMVSMETKLKLYGPNPSVYKKKEYDMKKIYGSLLKPTLSNQYLMKKMKKNNNIYHQYGGQDFSIIAKKTNFGQTFQANKMKY